MPFPKLSFFAGQSGLIVVGSTLLILAFFWNKLQPKLASNLFIFGNLMVLPIFLVAIYVHLHPDVPAAILPLESKPPYMAVFLIVVSNINMYLFNKKLHVVSHERSINSFR